MSCLSKIATLLYCNWHIYRLYKTYLLWEIIQCICFINENCNYMVVFCCRNVHFVIPLVLVHF